MNRIKIAVLVLIAALALTGCAPKTETVKIGIVGEESDMWTPVIEKLKKENIDIELVAFTDYNLPNAALADGDIDLNAFQHYAYFNNECETMGYDLIAIGEIGLAGEVRAVQNFDQRVSEAVRLGFTRIIVPERNLEMRRKTGKSLHYDGAAIVPVKSIFDQINWTGEGKNTEEI